MTDNTPTPRRTSATPFALLPTGIVFLFLVTGFAGGWGWSWILLFAIPVLLIAVYGPRTHANRRR